MRRPLALILLVLALCPAAAYAEQPTEPPLAYHLGDQGYALSRLDPLTLAPQEPHGDVGEWHEAYSLSPDGRQLASSISHPGLPGTPGRGRVGMRIYDLTTLEVVREFRLGVAASAVGWLAPRRLVFKTQGSRIGVADPLTGDFRETDRPIGPGCIDPPGKAVTPNRLVFLLGSTVNAVDRDGRRTHFQLRGMSNVCGRLGMATDRSRELVYVAGLGPEVAVVNPRAMRVRYRRVGSSRATRVASSRAELFGGFQFGLAHQNSRGMPRGVELIDLLERKRRMIDPRAGRIAISGERLYAYDGRYPVIPGGSKGIRVFGLSGRLRDRLLKREVVHELHVLGRFAYALTRDGLRVIDLRAREVVSRSAFDPTRDIHFVVPGGAGR